MQPNNRHAAIKDSSVSAGINTRNTIPLIWPILNKTCRQITFIPVIVKVLPLRGGPLAGLDDDGLNVMLNKLFFRENIQQHRLRPLKAAFRTLGYPRLILTIFSENNYCQCVFPAIRCAMRIGPTVYMARQWWTQFKKYEPRNINIDQASWHNCSNSLARSEGAMGLA